jgi:hypothetical protein
VKGGIATVTVAVVLFATPSVGCSWGTTKRAHGGGADDPWHNGAKGLRAIERGAMVTRTSGNNGGHASFSISSSKR